MHGILIAAKVLLLNVAVVAVGILIGAMLTLGGNNSSEQAPVPIKAIPPTPTPIKAVPRPPAQIVLPPPAPLYSGVWKETPKEECELLRDREESRLCVQYPLRESILNSLVLGHEHVHSFAGVRYKAPESCPIITTGEARALVCGKLAEQYELYCCK